MSLIFNTLSRFVIALLPRTNYLLISWLQSPTAVILEPKKMKSVTVSIVSPSICHEVMGLDAMTLEIWMLSFKPTLSLSSFTFIKRLFSSSLLSAIRVVSSACLRLLIFLLAILIPVYSLGHYSTEIAFSLNFHCMKYTQGMVFSSFHLKMSVFSHWIIHSSFHVLNWVLQKQPLRGKILG